MAEMKKQSEMNKSSLAEVSSTALKELYLANWMASDI
jgi:hypothetical protein